MKRQVRIVGLVIILGLLLSPGLWWHSQAAQNPRGRLRRSSPAGTGGTFIPAPPPGTSSALRLTQASSPSTITVTNTNDSGPGSLRQAIADAVDGDRINFSVTGMVGLTSGALSISKNLTINGPGPGLLTISGNNTSQVFLISGSVTVSGLTIAGGLSTGSCEDAQGGGINNAGSLALKSCTISGNTAMGDGGGIANFGNLTITHCTISDNSAASYAGGIRNNGTLTAAHSTISGNNSDSGGGIWNLGTMTLTNCTISGNTGARLGGGLLIESTHNNDRIVNCTIYGNTAPIGAGIETLTGGGGSSIQSLPGVAAFQMSRVPAVSSRMGTT